MTSILDNEQNALRLRRHLKAAHWPEIRLLCGLQFFSSFNQDDIAHIESYLREFIPPLSEAAGKCRPDECLPDDIDRLNHLLTLIKAVDGTIISPQDTKALQALFDTALSGGEVIPDGGISKYPVSVNCLFVEHNPDFDLPPRGRILRLGVRAEAMSAKTNEDDVVVRNPVDQPDDRFLAQARESIVAAREYLFRRYGLAETKRYRFDFIVDTTGARFTGDSLGVAFAAGAVAAVSAVEVFRDRLTVSPGAAFSGALTSDGLLSAIDGDALKLKIYRAFHSDLDYLVIPREHITEAWEYLSGLEKDHPNRKLELVGADQLDAIISDPRLLPVQRLSATAYAAKKVFHARRTTWVEVPALLVLLAIFFVIVAPARWMPWFDNNPAYVVVDNDGNGFTTYNADSLKIWSIAYPCGSIDTASGWDMIDFDEDGKNEVVFMPYTNKFAKCECNANYYTYDDEGQELYKGNCIINGQYPGDVTDSAYYSGRVRFVDCGDRVIILTNVTADSPSRSHLKFWTTDGKLVGWYINAGSIRLDDSCFSYIPNIGFVFLGINRRIQRAALVVLPVSSICGVSPPYRDPRLDLTWVKRGNQSYYITFPRSLLNIVDDELYNHPFLFEPYGESIRTVEIRETSNPNRLIHYHFGEHFNLHSVELGDGFVASFQRCIANGTIPACSADDYSKQLQDSVMYWTETGWITEKELNLHQ